MSWRFGRGGRDQQHHVHPISPDSWEGRLYAVGCALDGQLEPMRDLAVSYTNDHTFVSGLGRHSSLYQGGWASVTYRADHAADDHDAVAGSRREFTQGPAGRTWAMWLRAVGLLLDRKPGYIHDLCLLEVEGGVVVEATTSAARADEQVPTLHNREFTAAELEAVMAEPFVGTTLRPVTLQPLEGSR